MADTLFGADNTPVIDAEKDYFSELVGEGKKYRDAPAAGRAIIEKDQHISTIETENAQLRAELERRASVQSLIDKIAAAPARQAPDDANNQQRNPVDPPLTTAQAVSQPKVEDLVRNEVSKLDLQRRESANLTSVANALQAEYGPGFSSVLANRTAELGMDQKEVDALAKKSPQAVFKLLGIDGSKTPNPAPAARANPGTAGRTNTKNFAYYENLRKTAPQKYNDPRGYAEMMKTAEQMGDDFYR